jgi:hypothetical protein
MVAMNLSLSLPLRSKVLFDFLSTLKRALNPGFELAGAPEPGSGSAVHESGKVPIKDQAIGQYFR